MNVERCLARIAAAFGCRRAVRRSRGRSPTGVGTRPVPADRGHGLDVEPERVNQWIADVAVGRHPGGLWRWRVLEGPPATSATAPSTSRSREIPFQGRDPRTGSPTAQRPGVRVHAGRRRWDVVHVPPARSAASCIAGCGCRGRRSRRSSPGKITNWDDPEITADNNGFKLPDTRIIPVVRSDGSGTTAQFTAWMDNQYPSLWRPFCQCQGLTSYYPIKDGIVAQGRLGGRGEPHRGQLRERHHRLRRVLLRAQRQLPRREGAEQGRLLRRCRRPTTSRSRSPRPRSTRTSRRRTT